MVSVCVTTHNGEKYIKEQLESIICQLEKGDEVIVSDDSSTDATLSIIKALNDEKIKVLHHVHERKSTFPLDYPTHNFEYAIRHAQGDYIFLADQDDKWLEGKVKIMKEALNDATLVISDCKVTDENLNVKDESYFKLVGINTGVISNIIHSRYLGCCLAFRKELLTYALPFPKTKVGHDLWLGIVAGLFFKIALVRQPLMLYRKHGNSTTTSGLPSKFSLWFKINYRLYIIKETIKLVLRHKSRHKQLI